MAGVPGVIPAAQPSIDEECSKMTGVLCVELAVSVGSAGFLNSIKNAEGSIVLGVLSIRREWVNYLRVEQLASVSLRY